MDSANSLSSALAAMASDMQADNLQLAFSVAVMKNVQDSQKQFTNALLEMISKSPSPDPAIGRNLDVAG